MTDKKIIIIGAGIAGLATGYYARLYGYDVDIYEMHNKPGGMCTSWRRKDYIFDYCIHNLVGTAPQCGIHRVWEELGAFDGTDIIDRDEFACIETADGRAVHWYTDLARLTAHLKDIAPDDAPIIGELVNAARKLVGADLFSMQLGGLLRTFRALPRVPLLNRWSRVYVGEFAARFQDPFLRRALIHVMYDMPGEVVPMTALLLFTAGLSEKDLGWPVGGSLALSRRIEKRFLDLGGNILYKTRVEKILLENDRAMGVRLADGTEHKADRVISAADGYDTIYHMLEGRYLTPNIESYYGGVGDSSPFGFVIFLGLSKHYPDTPHALTLLLDDSIDLGDIRQDSLHLVTFGPETGLAPDGKSVLKIEVQASYPYWKTRRDADISAYREEKQRIADVIIDRISFRFPDLREHIEVIDISTPPTAERYTGNRFGWQAGPPSENVGEIQRHGLSRTLPGLDGFNHVGQWSMANLGVSSAAVMGRNLVKELCRRRGKKFVTG